MIKAYNPCVKNLPVAVLFDTDNTLYSYEPANHTAEKATASKAEALLGIKKKDFYDLYLVAKKQIKKQLGETASSHSRLLYFQRVIELLGLKAELLIALDLEQTFWRTFLANAPLFPGVLELLDELKRLQIKVAVVTDLTSNIQLRKLTYFRLEDAFDAVVTSEEVGFDKPNKMNFELVLNKLSIPNPPQNSIWMIGDNPYTDVLGGKSIGAVTFQKIHKGVVLGANEQRPDYSFNHFSELNTLVNSLSVH